MKELAKLREFFANDRFATLQGMEIDSVSPEGEAVCSVALRPEHRNAVGGVQGGLIFTLADFAFAVAANREKIGAVTLESSIHFIRQPKGERLIAITRCLHHGRSTCHYQVTVRDELDTLVATALAAGYILPAAAEQG